MNRGYKEYDCHEEIYLYFAANIGVQARKAQTGSSTAHFVWQQYPGKTYLWQAVAGMVKRTAAAGRIWSSCHRVMPMWQGSERTDGRRRWLEPVCPMQCGRLERSYFHIVRRELYGGCAERWNRAGNRAVCTPRAPYQNVEEPRLCSLREQPYDRAQAGRNSCGGRVERIR